MQRKIAKATTCAKITKELLKSRVSTGERQVWRDTECKGLLLRVNADGSKMWYFDYRDPQGRRCSYKVGSADRIDPGEARKKVNALGEDPAGERRGVKEDRRKAESRTLRKFLEGRYWDDCLARAKSGEATKKRIAFVWAPFLDSDMAALDPQDVHQRRLDRLEEGVTPQTLNRDRTSLLALLNQAVEWKLLSANPLEDPVIKPLETSDDKRVRWLGQHDEHEDIRDGNGGQLGERARFIAALSDKETPKYLHQLCIIAMNTGMRRGEIFKLKWKDVSIDRAEVILRAATTKANKPRHIPLNADVIAVLKELGKLRHISGYVFINPDTNAPFTTFKRSWSSLVTRAQLSDFTFHDLRHDFASRLVQAGVNLYEVKDLLGHSSITLTERYAHLAPAQKRAAVALLESVA